MILPTISAISLIQSHHNLTKNIRVHIEKTVSSFLCEPDFTLITQTWFNAVCFDSICFPMWSDRGIIPLSNFIAKSIELNQSSSDP